MLLLSSHCGNLLLEDQRIVVHVFLFGEIFGRFVSFEVFSGMDDFLLYSYMIMVVIICSWDQSCVRESITEAPCGNLGHDLVKKTTINCLGHKDIWISFENWDKKFPLCV